MKYPVGSQYASKTGDGSLLGMADDIMRAVETRQNINHNIELIKKERSTLSRDYVMHRRMNPPTGKMTNSMSKVVDYLKTHPGARRGDIFNEGIAGLSQSSLGLALKTLIDYQVIEGNGRTTSRKFYIAGVAHD